MSEVAQPYSVPPVPAKLSELPTRRLVSLPSPVEENWCHSQADLVTLSYTWTINNFSFRWMKPHTSSTFACRSNNRIKWCLKMCPSEDYMSLNLCLVCNNEKDLYAKVKLSILNEELTRNYTRESPGVCCKFVHGRDWEGVRIVRKNLLEKNGYLTDDVLSIVCKVSMINDAIDFGQSNCAPVTLPDCSLSDDLGQLLDQLTLSDVTLVVRGQEFSAHKALLAARSPVFNKMFTHWMAETKLNRVKISDMEPAVMSEMLRFIYTGRAANLDDMAEGLLAAADKYALEGLKLMCEDALSSNLSIENACVALMLADRHSADQLKSHSIHFINRHAAHVMESDGWKKMFGSHPHVIADAYRVLLSSYPSPPSQPPKTG